MKTRKKTKREIQQDLINTTERLHDLHKIGGEFITDYIECDGDVWYSIVMKFRNAVWAVDHAKRRLGQVNVSDKYGQRATYIGNYDD